ncbi:MAG TPA: DUF748 domain-containing protein, partial [Alphaproteobacteria bacterium]|nr:DUF748 domain-containing protein [Alphaproteobacteria bacterium]
MKVHPFLRRHRRPLITVVVLAAVFAIVLMVLPVAIRYAMVSWLRDDGRRKAEISDVDFNPFVARLVVHDLMIKGPDGNANVALASVELDPLALVRQRLHFATLRVEDAELTLTRLERGVRAADVPLGTGQQKQESGGGWSWGIDRLQLDDVVLHYRPAPASPPSRLTVSRLRLLELYSWRPEAEAPLQLQAALEDGELQVDGRMAPLAKAPSAELEVAVDKLDLARLWATGGPELAGHGPAPAGTADLNGHLLLNGGETLSATYQGSLALHRGAFGAGRLD